MNYYRAVDLSDGHDMGIFTEPDDLAAMMHATVEYKYDLDPVGVFGFTPGSALRRPLGCVNAIRAIRGR